MADRRRGCGAKSRWQCGCKNKSWSIFINKDLRKHNLEFAIWYNKDRSISAGVASYNYKKGSDTKIEYNQEVNYGQVVPLGILIRYLEIPRKDILKEIKLIKCDICGKEKMRLELYGLACYGCDKNTFCSKECLKKHWETCERYKEKINAGYPNNIK